MYKRIMCLNDLCAVDETLQIMEATAEHDLRARGSFHKKRIGSSNRLFLCIFTTTDF